MPNHVRNILKMQGIGTLPLYSMETADSEKNVEAAVALNEYFDFQKILPMPESLDLDSGSVENLAMEVALAQIAASVNSRYFPPFHIAVSASPITGASLEERVRQSGMTPEEAGELGLKYLENIIKYGHSSWYYWCVENWGTKWNSYDLDRIDEDTIAFSTAWANPAPVIEALSAQFPNRIIEHWWADEDMGENTGYRCIQDGCGETVTPKDGSSEALGIYVQCWGMDDSLRRDEQGNLYVVSEEEEEAEKKTEVKEE